MPRQRRTMGQSVDSSRLEKWHSRTYAQGRHGSVHNFASQFVLSAMPVRHWRSRRREKRLSVRLAAAIKIHGGGQLQETVRCRVCMPHISARLASKIQTSQTRKEGTGRLPASEQPPRRGIRRRQRVACTVKRRGLT